MNVKRYIVAVIAMFVFVFLYEWLVHGVLFMGIYAKTPNLWRPMAEMSSHMLLSTVVRLILCGWVAFVFTRFYKTGDAVKGLIFGLYLGVFAAILGASAYFWLPISAVLGWSWFIAALVEWIISGAIVGAIYRR